VKSKNRNIEGNTILSQYKLIDRYKTPSQLKLTEYL